jgi:glucose/arabinose dehydrogenase
MAHAGDGSGVLYVIEKPGTVRKLDDSERVQEPFLDITDRVGSSGYEQGLLGIAFPPDYKDSRVFYVNYTDLNGNTVVSRFTVADNDVADPASEQVILTQEQPYPNHNGGQLQFGPDGYLYIGLGDGGSGGDPQGNAQRLDTWLGKILRIDVDPATIPAGQAYAIPEDNPLVGQEGALPEIFAYGLRNPWRFSFDAETGDMLIADVGQNQIEEINVLPVNPGTAINFGWNPMEGSTCYLNPNCDASMFTLPIMEYTQDEGGCSVTGGEVYYGENLPDIYGTYIFADFCSGLVWQGVRGDDGTWTMSNPVESGLSISSFGVDEQGEVYVLDLASGIVFRLEAPI